MIVYLTGSDQEKLRATHPVYEVKTNQLTIGNVVSKTSDHVYKIFPVVQTPLVNRILAANGPSVYHEERIHV